MRISIGFFALLLAACSHKVTLYPRGGGDQATGTLNDGSRTITINLKGETYTGDYILGQTVGLGFAQTYGSKPVFGSGLMVASNNIASALLSSGKNVLRCEFQIQNARGANGVCIDKDNVVYDMLAKAS